MHNRENATSWVTKIHTDSSNITNINKAISHNNSKSPSVTIHLLKITMNNISIEPSIIERAIKTPLSRVALP